MIKLNEDKELVIEIRKKLKENKDKYGEQFCPCVIPTEYESENKEDYICMCKEFREQEDGECHCGLFVKTKEEQPIPKKIDYTGFENEYIKVLGVSDKNIQAEKNKNTKYKEFFWKCKCKKCNNVFHTASQNIKKIKSCGCSKKNRQDNKKYIIGYIGTTISGLKYKIIDRNNITITIQFLKTGYITKVISSKLSSGYIKDPYEPSVCGVGYLGKCDNINRRQEYNLWKGIIERCYNPKRQDYKNYGAKGITVCDRWKCFAYFLEDIKKIDGYDNEKFHNKELDLDKDVKQKDIPVNKKIYSLDTCMFLDKQINRSITTHKSTPNVKIISINGDKRLETNCPVEELAKQLEIKTQYITRILRGEAKTHHGWTFKYG